MKPTKNQVFCPDCGKTKMLFESESKAMNFIKFNKSEMKAEGKRVPRRAYYCQCCGGYHLTCSAYYKENITNTNSVIKAYRIDLENYKSYRADINRGVRALEKIREKLYAHSLRGTTPEQDELQGYITLYMENKNSCKAKNLKKCILAELYRYGIEV